MGFDKKKYESLSVRDLILVYQKGLITTEQLSNIITIKIALIGGGDWRNMEWLEKRMRDIYTRVMKNENTAQLLASDCKNVIKRILEDGKSR